MATNRNKMTKTKNLLYKPAGISMIKMDKDEHFPSKMSAAKAISKRPQLHPLVCFWTGG